MIGFVPEQLNKISLAKVTNKERIILTSLFLSTHLPLLAHVICMKAVTVSKTLGSKVVLLHYMWVKNLSRLMTTTLVVIIVSIVDYLFTATNHTKQKIPFVVYGDFESLLHKHLRDNFSSQLNDPITFSFFFCYLLKKKI